MTDPRNAARHREAVVERARRTLLGYVYPASWQERRALRRMTARSEAAPVVGLPNVWAVRAEMEIGRREPGDTDKWFRKAAR